MTTTTTSRDQAIKAAEAYLDHKDLELIDAEPALAGIDLVALDGKALVFVTVEITDDAADGFPKAREGRDTLEASAASWLANHRDRVDVPVRFDTIALIVTGPQRAFLRHHVNALSEA